MEITSLRAIPVRVPTAAESVRSALGRYDACEFSIVIVETDAGVRGLGEVSLIWHGNGARLASMINELVAPRLVGVDPFELTSAMAIVHDVFQFGRHSRTACAAVEMALLDVQGKASGQPVVKLLGGACADRLPLSMSLSIAAVPDVLQQARGFVSDGFRTVKVKCGRDVDYAHAVVAALRHEFGEELAIRVDANMACPTAAEALRLARRLEPFEILSLEQPLPPDDLDGLARLRLKTDIPIMLDESVWSPADCWRAVRAEAADLVNVYVAEAGGIHPARQIGTVCRLAGVGVAVGSMPELAIGTAAAAHFAFSQPTIDHPSDLAGFRYYRDDVVRHQLRIEDGYLYAPQEPGLGVELDEDRLRRYRINGEMDGSTGA